MFYGLLLVKGLTHGNHLLIDALHLLPLPFTHKKNVAYVTDLFIGCSLSLKHNRHNNLAKAMNKDLIPCSILKPQVSR